MKDEQYEGLVSNLFESRLGGSGQSTGMSDVEQLIQRKLQQRNQGSSQLSPIAAQRATIDFAPVRGEGLALAASALGGGYDALTMDSRLAEKQIGLDADAAQQNFENQQETARTRNSNVAELRYQQELDDSALAKRVGINTQKFLTGVGAEADKIGANLLKTRTSLIEGVEKGTIIPQDGNFVIGKNGTQDDADLLANFKGLQEQLQVLNARVTEKARLSLTNESGQDDIDITQIPNYLQNKATALNQSLVPTQAQTTGMSNKQAAVERDYAAQVKAITGDDQGLVNRMTEYRNYATDPSQTGQNVISQALAGNNRVNKDDMTAVQIEVQNLVPKMRKIITGKLVEANKARKAKKQPLLPIGDDKWDNYIISQAISQGDAVHGDPWFSLGAIDPDDMEAAVKKATDDSIVIRQKDTDLSELKTKNLTDINTMQAKQNLFNLQIGTN